MWQTDGQSEGTPPGVVKMDNQRRTEAVAATTAAAVTARPESRVDQALSQVRQALSGLQYGQIAITVQDGVVIQIERIERVRLRRGSE
jgi:hypothetical protein